MKYIVLALLMSLVVTPALAAKLYKWVDQNGVVHYSDQPHKGSKHVDLPGLTTFNSPPAPPSAPVENHVKPGPVFKTFAIVAPKQEQTLHANDGRVSVSVSLDPPLNRTESLVYKLDGKTVGTSHSTALTLTDVVRGTHILTVVVINYEGKPIASAKPVTFYVRHHSILN